MDKDMNERPHLLHIKVEQYGRYANLKYSVECPYEPGDIRQCGVIEECLSSEKDRLRWGCTPRPVEPKGMPEDMADNRYAWEQYFRADEEWQEEHLVLGGGGHGHRTEECWFTHILREGDIEPEDILTNIPDGTPIISPFKVEVHFEGSYDETEPNFIPWKDKSDADPS
jgi:hypothetical protein